MVTTKDKIREHLETSFEKELFKSSLQNLSDKSNRLRFNNFAYSIRELIRHFLERLSPDNVVRMAPWFKLYDPAKPKMITREQRIKYAIQGWFSDDYFKNMLKMDFSDISRCLRDSIDTLSKYTHIEESTFDIPEETVEELSDDVLQSTLYFFKAIDECQQKVYQAIVKCVKESIENELYNGVQDELDSLATHYEVLYFMIEDVDKISDDVVKDGPCHMELQAKGCLKVRLQYGSNGDMIRGDGYETTMDFPYESTVSASYNNSEYSILATNSHLIVDTDSFYF